MRRSAPGVVVDFAEFSDAGRDPDKQVNEDCSAAAATAHGLLAVVCDGVGGHVGGKEASHTAVSTILAEVDAKALAGSPGGVLRHAIGAAGRAIYAQGGNAPMGSRPGSTCVAVLIGEHGSVVAHVGDSRAYRLRNGNLHRLTRDHSVVQQLVDTGRLSPDEAVAHPDLNRITRALGVTPDVDVEVQEDTLLPQPEDVFLLCTDGLTDLVNDRDILEVLEQAQGSPDIAGRALIDLANTRGGHDNITVQLLRVVAAHESQRPRLAPTLADSDAPRSKAPGLTQPWDLSAPRTVPEAEAARSPLAPAETAPRAPARRPWPWALLLFVLGALVLGVLLGGVGLWWWLAHSGALSVPVRS